VPDLAVNGTVLFHRLDGPVRAPLLLLSGSLGTSHAMWEDQIAALTHRFRVLRYDTRGHGRSAVPSGPCDIATLGRDALGLLDALHVERAHFCGLSLGGMTGIWLAAHAPERVARLVLANTSSYLGARETWEARISAVRRGGMAAVTGGILERWFTPEFRAREPVRVERIRQMLLTTPPEGYAACAAAVRDMDQRCALAAISASTLVICGSADVATTPEHLRFIGERIPGARLTELPAAHLSNIEAAEAFNRAVLDFLE
jgi:3-oxoadipate enol-lactonase